MKTSYWKKLLTACALALLVLHWEVLLVASWAGVLALMALVAMALAIGHALGGPAPDDRTALAVACASRHIGIAVLVAASLPGPRTAVIIAVYIVASAVVCIPYLRWRRNRRCAHFHLHRPEHTTRSSFMTPSRLLAACGLTLALVSSSAFAGIVDPDCTPEKAAKSAAAKSTVGVGGRCDAKEAAKDSARRPPVSRTRGRSKRRRARTTRRPRRPRTRPRRPRSKELCTWPQPGPARVSRQRPPKRGGPSAWACRRR